MRSVNHMESKDPALLLLAGISAGERVFSGFLRDSKATTIDLIEGEATAMYRATAASSSHQDSDNHLATYIRHVNSITRLEREEEVVLAKEIAKGSQDALDRLIQANLFLTVKIARNYQRTGISFLDLINEGNLGLMRAARKYNPTFGIRFSSYANWWIKQRISIYLIQHGRGSISVPIRKVVLFKAITKESQVLQNRLQRKPSLDELSERLQVDTETLEETIRAMPEYVSMDEVLAGHSSSFGASGGGTVENASQVEARLERNTFHRDLKEILAPLSEKEREGVVFFFGLTDGKQMNFADLGRRLRMSREGARQLIRRSLNKIRKSPKIGMLKEYL